MSGAVYRDLGLEALLIKLSNAAGLELHVGCVGAAAEAEASGGRITVGEAFALNEFGSSDGHIPRREPLQRTLRDRESEIRALMTTAALTLLSDNAAAAAEKALTKVGEEVVSMVRQTINELPADNAPATVKKKGFDAPLIDSGEMIRAISAVVVRSGSSDDYDEVTVSSEVA